MSAICTGSAFFDVESESTLTVIGFERCNYDCRSSRVVCDKRRALVYTAGPHTNCVCSVIMCALVTATQYMRLT